MVVITAPAGLCHGHGSARHGIRCSAGCGTQPPYPWGKAGLKRSGSRERDFRFFFFSNIDMTLASSILYSYSPSAVLAG